MALEFIDGFDHYTTQASMRLKWGNVGSCIPGSPGRYGGLAVNWGFEFTPISVPLPSVTTRYVGIAMYFGVAGTDYVIHFFDSAQTQCKVGFNSSSGTIYVARGDNTLLGTLDGIYMPFVWYYIEVGITIGTSTGAVTVRVNGVTRLAIAGVNTQVTGNNTCSGVGFGGFNMAFLADDLYILNTSGTVNNTFLGDTRVITVLPSADSSVNAAWTPNAGTAHFSRVNEPDPDGDTSYNSTPTVGAIDTYKFPAIVTTALNIAGVQNVLTARKDDAGNRTLVSECRSGAGNFDGATQFAIGGSYAMYRQILETDPATGAAWTFPNLNNAEFGAKVIA